jgi:hypothetical protein
MMHRRWLLLGLFLIPLLAGAETASLKIGETTIRFPVEAGYVPLSTAAPEAFERRRSHFRHVLVETFVADSDVTRIQQSDLPLHALYDVQVPHDYVARKLSDDEWTASLHRFGAEMGFPGGNLSAAPVYASGMFASNGRGQPAVYRVANDSVGVDIHLSAALKVNDASVKVDDLIVATLANIRHKLVVVTLAAPTGGDFDELNARMDTTMDQIKTLNADNGLSLGGRWLRYAGQLALIVGILAALFFWLRKQRSAAI